METTAVSYVGGATPTDGVLCYTHIGSRQFLPPREMYAFGTIRDDSLKSGQDFYYSLFVHENVTRNQIEIIHNFVSTLVEDSEDLDPNFSQMVDKHFWDLA